MATTTTTATFSVTGDNIYYDTPEDYGGENASYILTTNGTISGANDEVYVNYGTNDVLIVTGVNDSVGDYSYSGDGYGFGHALINAQNATGNGDYEVEGPASTILSGGGNDELTSYGGYTQSTSSSSTTSGGTTTDNDQVVTTVGNVLYGGAGDDHIYMSYADTVYGGAGNDTIVVNNDDVDHAPSYTGTGHLPGAYIDAGAGNDGIDLSAVQYAASTAYASSSFDYSTIIGGDGDDTIQGGFYNHESITGGAGNDDIWYVGNDAHIDAGEGANYVYDIGDGATILSGAGNDLVEYVGNDAYISVGDGDNEVYYANDGATILSGAGNDDIEGIGNDAYISTGAGNDVIDGVGYGSFIDGGAGDDTIEATSGGSVIYGHAGNDVIQLSGYGDVVFAGAGNDIITATGGYDGGSHFISADLGNDTVDLSDTGYGENTVYGGGGDDTIYGSSGYGYDQLYGQSGNDTIYVESEYSTVYGGQGNDLIYDGGNFSTFISGDLGDDSIFASGANDTLYGGGGNDSIAASGANDQIYGQAGNDVIIFDATTNAATAATIYGGQGNDFITVSYADHQVSGSYTGGAETVNGATYDNGSYTQTVATDGVGHHYLSGDIGADTIYGGSGGDTFVGGAGSDDLVSHRLEAQNATSGPGTPGYAAGGDADTFIVYQNDSVGANPAGTGTGSDISANGGEAGIDHITGFEFNITGQAYVASTAVGATPQSYINGQAGDNLYFLTGTHDASNATLDSNVFYGIAHNTIPAGTATEASDYAVAYAYAFGTGGTASAETSDAHFASAVDFIVVDVVDDTATNNGNVFVFDHNGNAVALDGAALPSTGTSAGDTGTVAGNSFQTSNSPSGGIVDAPGTSVVTVNIYH